MSKLIIAFSFMTLLAGGATAADDARPEHETTFNASLVSDYRYRGLSQTRFKPALQGGADYTHSPSGLYAGAWFSTITWINDAGGSDRIEADLYAGKRGTTVGDISYDVGVLAFLFPSSGLRPTPNTTEIYGQLSSGPAYVKYSLAVTTLFGYANSKRSDYLDVGANIAAAYGVTVNLHAGHQRVQHNAALSYSDWKLGLTKDVGFATAAIAVVGTNADRSAYASAADASFLGKTGLAASLSKTF